MTNMDISKVVVSSRIRLARNICGLGFVPSSDKAKCTELIGKVNECVKLLGRYKVYHMGALSEEDARVMKEKHLISKELLKNKICGAALIKDDETISIMVNEEDHIRAQCILKGFKLEEAYSLINEIDDELDSKLDIAYDEALGYLTSCLTNVGTGIRASVMVFLPALTIGGEIDKIIMAVKEKGLTVRGELGEGSFPLGYLYQVSNAVSIGVSEREIVSSVVSAVNKIVELELEYRKKLLSSDPDFIVDMAWRAYGILSNAYTIDYEEFMKLMGEVKLGVHLGLISLKEPDLIDKLLVLCTDSGLIKLSGKMLKEDEIARSRANYLMKAFKRARIN